MKAKNWDKEKENKVLLFTWIFVLAFLLLAFGIFLFYQPVTVSFIHVGQGDACLISAGYGGNVLIDGGDDGSGFILEDYFRVKNIAELDAVFLSHFHEDHVLGVLELMEDDFPIEKIYISQYQSRTELEEEILNLAKEKKIPVFRVQDDEEIRIGKADYRVISQEPYTQEDNLNDMSMILRVNYQETSVLFTGDVERSNADKVQREDGKPLKTDILKVPHHGGASSLSQEFLASCDPDWAVIPVGSNHYGMPSDAVLAELLAMDTGVFRTDRDGTVVMTLGKDGVRNISYTPQWR